MAEMMDYLAGEWRAVSGEPRENSRREQRLKPGVQLLHFLSAGTCAFLSGQSLLATTHELQVVGKKVEKGPIRE